MKIAAQEWACVTPEKLSPPGTYPDFADYVSEKIEMSLSASDVKNRCGFIVEAIRENYQYPEVEKERRQRVEKIRDKALEDLTMEFNAKLNNILRQAVHADPGLVAAAAERVQTYIVSQRLDEHAMPLAAYQKGGMVAAEINAILAAEFCEDLLGPVVAAYEDEKARLFG